MTNAQEELLYFKRIPVKGDGDCFYHAFIQGTGIKQTPAQLRDQVAKVIENNKILFDDLVSQWSVEKVVDGEEITPRKAADRIRYTKEWAVGTEIHVLSMLYKVNVYVVKRVTGMKLVDGEKKSVTENHVQIFPYPWIRKPFRQGKKVYLWNSPGHFDLLESVKHNDVEEFQGTIDVPKILQTNEGASVWFSMGVTVIALVALGI